MEEEEEEEEEVEDCAELNRGQLAAAAREKAEASGDFERDLEEVEGLLELLEDGLAVARQAIDVLATSLTCSVIACWRALGTQ
jgi:hypothetical protein